MSCFPLNNPIISLTFFQSLETGETELDEEEIPGTLKSSSSKLLSNGVGGRSLEGIGDASPKFERNCCLFAFTACPICKASCSLCLAIAASSCKSLPG